MDATFSLTMPEAPRKRAPYEYSRDGQTWTAKSAAEVRYLLEVHSAFPDADRDRIDSGETIRTDRNGGAFFRRVLSEQERADSSRQASLF